MPNFLDDMDKLHQTGKENQAPLPLSKAFEAYFEPQQTLLLTTLLTAFPLWVDEIRLLDWPERIRRAQRNSQLVAEKGDLLLFRSKTKGETAKVFNAMAEGIAILSFLPGGVTLFGEHFETKDSPPL